MALGFGPLFVIRERGEIIGRTEDIGRLEKDDESGRAGVLNLRVTRLRLVFNNDHVIRTYMKGILRDSSIRNQLR